MHLSIQTLIEEFKAVVLEKDELEYRDMSLQSTVLPLLAIQDSKSDAKIAKIMFRKQNSASKKLSIDVLIANETGRIEEALA